jgi:hypothetical protein
VCEASANRVTLTERHIWFLSIFLFGVVTQKRNFTTKRIGGGEAPTYVCYRVWTDVKSLKNIFAQKIGDGGSKHSKIWQKFNHCTSL